MEGRFVDGRLQQIASGLSLAGKYLLATGKIPLTVDLGFCATHVAFNRQARLILETDGHTEAAGLLEAYGRELDLGVCWADSGWGCLHHFYHARTGNGLFGRAPADVIGARHYKRALGLWRQGNFRKAMFFLGAVTHLLQDVCEPHHSHCSVDISHHQYEAWVQKHKDCFLIQSQGVYKKFPDPAKWLRYCALKSYSLFDLVDKNADAASYQEATDYLLPFTQQVTAGFWLHFLEQVGVARADAELRQMARQ
jgi:phospholipase C